MSLTRFPNGITAASGTALAYTTAATDGDGDFNRLYVNGILSLSGGTGAGAARISTTSTATFIGERAYIPFTFTSAASTAYFATPFNGNIIDCWVTCDTTPTTCSGFTVRCGSGGAIAVATVATLVYATNAGQQVQPALTITPITTVSAISVVVTTAGTAANFSGTVVLLRTA